MTRYQRLIKAYVNFCAWHNVFTMINELKIEFDMIKRIYQIHAKRILSLMKTYKVKRLIKFEMGYIAYDEEFLAIRYDSYGEPRTHIIGIKDGELNFEGDNQ